MRTKEKLEKARRYSKSDDAPRPLTLQTHAEYGFPNKDVHQIVQEIADEETSSDRRQVLMQDLAAAYTTLPKKKRATPRNNTKAGKQFVAFQVSADEDVVEDSDDDLKGSVFSAMRQEQRVIYPISNDLPHVALNIGRQFGHTLDALFDTGGCSSIGHKPYFMKIMENYPDLIASHQVLNKTWNETISIGGIGGKIEITDVMNIWMPHKYQGECSRLVIGLSDDMPITCIVGITFITSAKCVHDVDSNTVVSKTLDCKWKVTMKPPILKSLDALQYPNHARNISFNTDVDTDESE
jgi:hypothetical protein